MHSIQFKDCLVNARPTIWRHTSPIIRDNSSMATTTRQMFLNANHGTKRALCFSRNAARVFVRCGGKCSEVFCRRILHHRLWIINSLSVTMIIYVCMKQRPGNSCECGIETATTNWECHFIFLLFTDRTWHHWDIEAWSLAVPGFYVKIRSNYMTKKRRRTYETQLVYQRRRRSAFIFIAHYRQNIIHIFLFKLM